MVSSLFIFTWHLSSQCYRCLSDKKKDTASADKLPIEDRKKDTGERVKHRVQMRTGTCSANSFNLKYIQLMPVAQPPPNFSITYAVADPQAMAIINPVHQAMLHLHITLAPCSTPYQLSFHSKEVRRVQSGCNSLALLEGAVTHCCRSLWVLR